MLSLDIRTLSFLAMFSSLLLALGLQFVSRIVPEDRSLRLWAKGATANSAAYVLLALRGIAPDFISIIVANTLLVMGAAWLYQGNRSFQGRDAGPPWYWFLAAIAAALLCYYTYLAPSLSARIVVLSAAVAAVGFPSVFVMLDAHDRHDRLARWIVAAVYLGTALLLLARAIVTLFAAVPEQDFLALTSPIHTLAIAFGVGLHIVLGIILPSLVLGRTHRRLLESEERYSALFESAKAVMLLTDPQSGAIVAANPAARRFYGYGAVQMLQMKMADINMLSPDELAAEEQRARAEQRECLFFPHRLASGEMRQVEAYSGPFRYGGKTLLYSIIHDITERKLDQQRVQGLIAEQKAMLENDLIGIARVRDRTNIWVNPAFEKMLGYAPGELAGTPSRQNYPGEEAYLAFGADAYPILAAGSVYRAQIELVRKDRRRIWVDISGSMLDRESGESLWGFVDVSARKQAESARASLETQLRESQKMEALGTLAGGVAHDFNNALAAILGNVELARQDLGPGHAAQESLEEIGKAGRRAKDLVQQILAFGRQQKLERKATSLALPVVETARLVRATLPAMVSLSVDCAGDTPVVLADATQIKQILLNLCSNARQAVQDQNRLGEIEIRLDQHLQQELRGALRPGRYARLTVRDNGSGMDSATRARIFEPFFTTKAAGKGTGLGLSVVHGIVQAHAASIEVESTLGAGSAFRIYFPAAEAAAAEAAPPAPASAPASGQGKRVLYVDDEEAIVFLMTRLLERRGYRVSGYTDPREALAAARANPGQFDLVVTDYNMPGMSGLEFARAVREIRADLPVVLASGYITEELRQKAPAAGICELIYKPNTVEDLCEAVARLTHGQVGSEIAS